MNRTNRLWILLSLAIPLTALAPFATSVAQAEEAPAAAEARPETTPTAVDARFQRYILAPNGRITALVLQNGTVVHVRTHTAEEPAANLHAGDALHIEGGLLKTPTGALITRAVVQQGGKVIADGTKEHGRGHHDHHGKAHEGRPHAPLQEVVATARITQLVSGPRGHLHEVLLDDGTSAGGQLDALGLKVGDRITVAGQGGAYPQGKALRINTITLPSGEVRTLPQPQRHHERKGPPPGSAPA
jgi:hypothetical protein